MKKIALASAAMGGAALIAFGASGTFAAFQDAETASGGAGAGTMDLTVGGASVTGQASPLSLNPGQSTTVSYWINNAGTVAGNLTADLTVTENAENGCQDAETKAAQGQTVDPSCDAWGTGGEFSQFATVQFLDSTAGTPGECAIATVGSPVFGMPPVTLDTAAGAGAVAVGSLGAGGGNCIVVKVELPSTAGNIVQSDTAAFTVDVTLKQA